MVGGEEAQPPDDGFESVGLTSNESSARCPNSVHEP